MKLFNIILTFLLVGSSFGQSTLFPYTDNQGFIKSFDKGYARQVDYLPAKDLVFGDNLVAYVDNKGDLIVYNGKKKIFISSLANAYQVSDNILAWNAGRLINTYYNGKQRTITQFGERYMVSDSLVVFDDIRENALKAYYRDSIYTLYTSTVDIIMPKSIGVNNVAFKGDGDVHYIFSQGVIRELGVWYGDINYSSGTDLVAFNDPINQSFAVLEKGEFFDIESTQIRQYKAGKNFIAYTDLNENLIFYKNGRVEEISNYSTENFQVTDSLVVWQENGMLFCYDGVKKYEVATFIPVEWKAKNNVIAYRSVNGGLMAFQNGRSKIVTQVMDVPFEINQNIVRAQLIGNQYIFHWNGKNYTME